MRIELDSPVHPVSRYGHGKPAHAALYDIINHRREVYRGRLAACLNYAGDFQRIPRAEPYWSNDQLTGLDAVCLYALLAEHRPERFIEIGSGHSTLFARRAILDHRLPTRLISVDPQPRTRVDSICDVVVRAPLEDADLSLFDALAAGDFVFFDGSHRTFTNSDVTVFFLEVLPRLRPGIFVQVHDVYLPFDYPPELAERLYSEQYLLACYLLSGSGRLHVELPNAFISQDQELRSILDPIWQLDHLRGIARHGVSFWFRTA
jgi:hypothetical protein